MTKTGIARTNPISPIRVSPNGRYFVDKAGQAVFVLGDTQWELFRKFRPSEALELLQNRQAKGVNFILIMLMGVDRTKSGGSDVPDELPYTNLDGQRPWIDRNTLEPNEKYFQNIDGMIRMGEQTGQTFVVGVFHQWDSDVITTANARSWARWIASRYRDVPNLIWSMYPRKAPEYIPLCRELAAGLREGDGGTHMISVHPDPSVASSSFIHQEEWLDFNMIQTCTSYDKIHQAVTADYLCSPAKPVIMAEGGYEGIEFLKVHSPHLIRKQAYWTQLAGGFHVYGHNDSWTNPRMWQQWMDAPGLSHVSIMKEIMTSLDEWWNMAPDQTLFASGAGSGMELNVAARSTTGRWIIAYLSEPSTVSLRLDCLTAGKRIQAQWINPISGDRQLAQVSTSTGTQSFSSPKDWADAVLVITAD